VRALFEFIVKFHFFILFLLFEVVCFTLAINNNEPHQKKFISSANYVSGVLNEGVDAVTRYFNLAEVNNELAEENTALRNNAPGFIENPHVVIRDSVNDTVTRQQYTFIAAQVVSNSVVNQKNFLTLNKGTNEGIQQDMAVIGPRGIVGIVYAVTDHYATVMSVLNIDYKVSANIRRTNDFGSLIWEGDDYKHARLLEIPYHVNLRKGDTIVTNGFSNVYPAGIPIGVISKFSKSTEENFYDIDVELSTNFKNVEHVYIIQNILKQERDSLESTNHAQK